MSEDLEKSDRDKVSELYQDWYGSSRDPERAFRTRFVTIENWYKNHIEVEALKKAEEKGRRFLTEQVSQLLKYIGFAGLITLIGLAIRLYNSWQGGTP